MALFKKKEKEKKPHKEIDIQKEIKKAEKEDESLWIKCSSCQELLYRKEVERNLDVCLKCSYHFPISVEKRIALIFDEGSFTELYTGVEPVDFLKFKDTKSYKVRLVETKEATKTKRRRRLRQGADRGHRACSPPSSISASWAAAWDPWWERRSRGSSKRAANKRLPVIVFCASGGARMQEGIMSLMQMAKVSGAIYRLKCRPDPLHHASSPTPPSGA